jgi:hypothetical protein
MKISELNENLPPFPLTDEENKECISHLDAAMRILYKYELTRPEALKIYKILEDLESFL